jgi:hypothetical protein
LIQLITGTTVDPVSVDIASFSVDSLQGNNEDRDGGEYNEELFSHYLSKTSKSLFDSEISAIDKEIAKYRPREEDKKKKQYR